LAFDLLARGYAVEIVSPDSIPDNLADLELRVEEDPGNQLVASVEAHNGERTASLEFLHYLKAPMPDFIRRLPPEPHEAVPLPEPPVSFNAEQSAEEVELPADAPQPAPTAVAQTAKTLRDSKLDSELDHKPDSKDDARLTLPPDPLPSPAEPTGHDAVVVSTMAKPTIAEAMIAKAMFAKRTLVKATISKATLAKATIARILREWEWRDRSAGWSSGRIALIVIGVLLLVLVLGYGMRRTNKASAQSSGSATTKKVAEASSDMNLLNGMGPKKNAETNPLSPPAKSDDNSNHTPKESQVATAATANAGSGATVARRHGDGLIARDTVTYLSQRTFDEAASRTKISQPSASRQPISRKPASVIAANAVTLDDKPAPKAAKQDSGIKRYSDLK
jgi:cell division protein FtsN